MKLTEVLAAGIALGGIVDGETVSVVPPKDSVTDSNYSDPTVIESSASSSVAQLA
jgi:hypothetical protein